MSPFKLGFLALVMAFCSSAAAASTVHKVRFAQPAMVMVWEDGAFLGHGAKFNLDEGASEVSPDFPGSGQLVSSRADLNGQRVISIASNAGFEISATSALQAEQVTVEVIASGPNARAAPQVLPEAGSRVIYRQTQKTALQSGTPESQTLTLRVSWTGPAPLLTISAL